MKRRSGWVALPLLFLASSERLDARVPPDAPPLVRRVDKAIPPGEPDSSVLREMAVEVDLRVARDSQTRMMRLPLFEGAASLDLVQTRRKRTRDGSVIWSGRVEGQPASTVIFSVGRDVLVANIATQPTKERDADYYQIRFLGGGTHVLRQIDPSKLAREGTPSVPEALDSEPQPTCSTDPPGTIDVLVVYTRKAREAAGGEEAMKEAIEVYVEESNTSYAQSGVELNLRLVGTKEVDYEESDHPRSDLNALKRPGGELDEVRGLRDAAGADLVVLIVEYSKRDTDRTSCGNAFVMETVSNAFESSAYAVVPRRCADSTYSFTHEVGHLMGARHDWADDASATSPNKPFPFSHCFVHLPKSNTTRPAFRTLMATDAECVMEERKCNRVLFWSNPEVMYAPSGVPMGKKTEDEPSNNSQTLKNTASTVANFRCRKS